MDQGRLITLTAKIVAAHCASNKLDAEDLPAFIQKTYASLKGIDVAEDDAATGKTTVYLVDDDDDFEMSEDEIAQQSGRRSVQEAQARADVEAEEAALNG